MELTPEIIKELIDKMGKPAPEFIDKVSANVQEFVYVNSRKPTVDEMKYIYASVYVDLLQIEEISE
jgi:hypothetical protein